MGFFKKDDPIELIKKGDFSKAIRIIKKRLENNKDDLNLKMKLGEAYEGLKDYENAVLTYLELASDFLKGLEKEKAYAVLKRAERIAPENQEVKERLNALEEKGEAFSFEIELEEKPQELEEEKSELFKIIKELFKLGDNASMKVTQAFELKKLRESEVLIREGEEGDSIFVIVNGKLGIFSSEYSESEPVVVLEKGEIVGEVSFLKGVPRTATVVAYQDSEIGELKGSKARELLSPYGDLLNFLEKKIEERVEILIEKIKKKGKSDDYKEN